jgi:hypothetical protein
MHDVHKMLERQATWQRSRANLSWPEKIRQAEILRDTFLKMRRTRPTPQQDTGATTPLPRTPASL